MLTRDQIARKILKLRALAERPGSDAEGAAARAAIAALMKDYGISDDDLRLRAETDDATTGPERSRPTWSDVRAERPGVRPQATAAALREHGEHPSRVHLAYDYMSSVCGVGVGGPNQGFVWVHTRDKLLTYDDPCPFCLASGILDTRIARKRLGPA